MLKREWGAESKGKLPHLFMLNKTATLVPEFAVEDLSWAKLNLGSCFSSEGPALGQNTLMMMMMMVYIWRQRERERVNICSFFFCSLFLLFI